jgi:large repetitive protein
MENYNGIADIREILHSYTPAGSNNFTTALTQIDNLFTALTGDPNLIFLSDGYGRLNPAIASSVVTDIKAKGGNVSAFGIGEASTVETLQKIDPNAIRITDFQQLVKIFSGADDNYAIEPLKQNVTVYLDANNNGQLDLGEANQITRTNPTIAGLGTTVYNYSFNNLLPGNYTIRTLVPTGYALTTPAATTFTITGTSPEFTHLTGIGKITPPVNVEPVFITTAPTGTKLPAGGVFTYRSHAVDNNADPLTYSLINAPTGMTVDANTGIVVWNPTLTQVENYYQELAAEQARLTASGRGAYARTKVEFDTYLRVSDGQGGQALQVLKLELLPNNRAPIFTNTPTNITPQIGKVFEYLPTAVDPDSDPISYSLIGTFNPTGVTIDTATGKVTWTPTAAQIGNQQISLQVTDSKGGSSIQKLALTVINPVINRAPEITSIPRTQTGSGQVYVYQVAATDADGDKLTYTLTNPPAGMVIDTNTGLITWTPTAAQSGVKNVAITVSDGTLTTQQTYALTVGNTPINHSPEITSTPSFTTNLDKTYSYQLTGKDTDNDTLIWSLDNAPKGMVIDSSTGIVKWNPTSTQLGSHTIAVRLTDAYGLYVGQEYTLKVNGVNTPPQIQSSPNTVGGLNSPYKYQVKAVDLEGDTLTYTLGRRPTGMMVDANTGLITWTPNAVQIGSQIIDVLVTDTSASLSAGIQGAVSTQTYNLVVGSTPINQAPTITSTPKFTADVNSPYQYQVVGTDPENNQITYALANAPTGMVIDASTGLITWSSPTLGTTQIAITATDPSGAVATQGYTLTGKQNHAPIINSTPVTQVILGNTYRYDVIATDSDNDALTYTLDTADLTAGVSIDKLGRITWKPTTTQIGVQPVTVTVTDVSGAAVAQTHNLQVLADNTAPVINLVSGTNIANIGETISFFVQATDNVGIKSTQLLINNQAVALDANGVGTYTVTVAGVVTAQAIVTDVNGNVSTANSTANSTTNVINLAGRPYVPQDNGFGNRYLLTTKDGTKYEINATTGDLESVTDTNGNVLTYSDTEIKSSTGVKVTFERDNQGRITSVTDPLGQKVKYGYDVKGDLVSVKDRDGNETKFEYNATRSHYLDKIVDPLGREAVKTEYDENGRLKKTANSSGNGVEFVYNPLNSLETVKDALGNATTYEYDTRGNIVTEVDAVGKITKSTYDDDNNMLSETVISDRSGAAGFSTTYTYDNQRNKLSETDALGNTTYYTYGEKGRLLTTTDALGRTNSSAYDSKGNLVSSKDAKGQIITISYDSRGQLDC